MQRNPGQSQILHSTSWIPDSRFWISVFVSGTRILHSNLWRIPDSLSCIPDSTSKIFTESRFNDQKFRESGFLTCGKKDKPYLHLWETERTILPMLSLTPSARQYKDHLNYGLFFTFHFVLLLLGILLYETVWQVLETSLRSATLDWQDHFKAVTTTDSNETVMICTCLLFQSCFTLDSTRFLTLAV